MAETRKVPDRIVKAALELAAERPWGEIALGDIAEAANLPMSKVYPHFQSKRGIVAAFRNQIDEAMLAEQEKEASEAGARERLFDVLMHRFDALKPHRLALGSILGAEACDPVALACSLARTSRSMRLALEAARLSASGPQGYIRIKALSSVYLNTLPVFLRDESEDMSRTMAHLDRQLGRLDALARRVYRTRESASGAAQ